VDLGSDILPRECTPAEIKSLVAEAGKVLLDHETAKGGVRSFSVGSSHTCCGKKCMMAYIVMSQEAPNYIKEKRIKRPNVIVYRDVNGIIMG
jgi:hypothetical protein